MFGKQTASVRGPRPQGSREHRAKEYPTRRGESFGQGNGRHQEVHRGHGGPSGIQDHAFQRRTPRDERISVHERQRSFDPNQQYPRSLIRDISNAHGDYLDAQLREMSPPFERELDHNEESSGRFLSRERSLDPYSNDQLRRGRSMGFASNRDRFLDPDDVYRDVRDSEVDVATALEREFPRHRFGNDYVEERNADLERAHVGRVSGRGETFYRRRSFSRERSPVQLREMPDRVFTRESFEGARRRSPESYRRKPDHNFDADRDLVEDRPRLEYPLERSNPRESELSRFQGGSPFSSRKYCEESAEQGVVRSSFDYRETAERNGRIQKSPSQQRGLFLRRNAVEPSQHDSIPRELGHRRLPAADFRDRNTASPRIERSDEARDRYGHERGQRTPSATDFERKMRGASPHVGRNDLGFSGHHSYQEAGGDRTKEPGAEISAAQSAPDILKLLSALQSHTPQQNQFVGQNLPLSLNLMSELSGLNRPSETGGGGQERYSPCAEMFAESQRNHSIDQKRPEAKDYAYNNSSQSESKRNLPAPVPPPPRRLYERPFSDLSHLQPDRDLSHLQPDRRRSPSPAIGDQGRYSPGLDLDTNFVRSHELSSKPHSASGVPESTLLSPSVLQLLSASLSGPATPPELPGNDLGRLLLTLPLLASASVPPPSDPQLPILTSLIANLLPAAASTSIPPSNAASALWIQTLLNGAALAAASVPGQQQLSLGAFQELLQDPSSHGASQPQSSAILDAPPGYEGYAPSRGGPLSRTEVQKLVVYQDPTLPFQWLAKAKKVRGRKFSVNLLFARELQFSLSLTPEGRRRLESDIRAEREMVLKAVGPPPSPAASSASARSRDRSDKTKEEQPPFCHRFNYSSCKQSLNCRYRHICLICFATDHRAADCTKGKGHGGADCPRNSDKPRTRPLGQKVP